jgi:hypothetical protein
MIRIVGWCFLLVVGCTGSKTDEPSELKKLVQEMIDDTLAGKYAKVIDKTYPGVVKLLGGREQAIQTTETVMKQIADQGFKIKSYTFGEPGELIAGEGNTFVIIPTKLEMTFAQGKVISESYLLGISPDGGKTWTFADGAGLETKEARDKSLPKLPEKLKLPEKKDPQVIKD